MVPDLEKAQVTELHVRMDCNGCVQRIKRAIISIDGVNSIYVDLAQQKLTVVGNADPERMVRAIRKARKTATICSQTNPEAATADPPPPAEAAAPPAEAEPPKDEPPPPPEEPTPEPQPDTTEVHMVHHYPHNYVYREHNWSHDYHPSSHDVHYTAAPRYVTQSYSNYQPSASVSQYGYLRSPPRDMPYSGGEAHNDGYHHGGGRRDGNQMTSMFSDENPNACTIV